MRPGRRTALKRKLRNLVLKWLAPVARHPLASVVTGLGLLLSGLVDLLEDVFLGFETAIEAYHGIMLLGIVTGLRGIAELVEGIEWLTKDAEKMEEIEEMAVSEFAIEGAAPPAEAGAGRERAP